VQKLSAQMLHETKPYTADCWLLTDKYSTIQSFDLQEVSAWLKDFVGGDKGDTGNITRSKWQRRISDDLKLFFCSAKV
jgi:hypothetical protein